MVRYITLDDVAVLLRRLERDCRDLIEEGDFSKENLAALIDGVYQMIGATRSQGVLGDPGGEWSPDIQEV